MKEIFQMGAFVFMFLAGWFIPDLSKNFRCSLVLLLILFGGVILGFVGGKIG